MAVKIISEKKPALGAENTILTVECSLWRKVNQKVGQGECPKAQRAEFSLICGIQLLI